MTMEVNNALISSFYYCYIMMPQRILKQILTDVVDYFFSSRLFAIISFFYYPKIFSRIEKAFNTYFLEANIGNKN